MMASKEIALDITLNNSDERIISAERDLPDYLERVQFTVEATERGPPPSYEEAMDPSRAPPPSYESVIGRVREAHKQSSGTFDFFMKLIVLLAGTLGYTVGIGMTAAMFLIGLRYLNECPVNILIPVYLLVGGFVGVFKQFLQLLYRFRKVRNRSEDEEEEPKSSFQSLITCFMLSWFFLGSYWVYKEYKPNYDPRLGLYCNRTVYLFAFWQVTIVYIAVALMKFCLCFISMCLIYAHSQTYIHQQLDTSPSH